MNKSGPIRKNIEDLAKERILILDGAMGALIQAHRKASGEALGEEDFRGKEFAPHPRPLKGCNDLLCLSQGEIVYGIHRAYLEVGADIIETNSFNATAVSLADFGLEDRAYDISLAAARLARRAADEFSSPDKPRFVAGSVGPTAKSGSISPDLNDPGKRAIYWDELEGAYYDNIRGLLDGGADLILIETIIDTLNAKAAIFAARRLEEERGLDIPLIISATLVNSGGRLLSGQTLEAFCTSVLHANPLALGLNCSFGAEKLLDPIKKLSAMVPCLVSAYPNAGFPDSQGVYDEDPQTMAGHVEEYLRVGAVNIIGGCCGSTPAHIQEIAARASAYAPRPLPILPPRNLLSGLELYELPPSSKAAEGGCDAAENPEFLALLQKGDYEEAVEIGRQIAEEGLPIEVCMDHPLIDGKTAMREFLLYALQFPDLARLPFIIRSSRWDIIEEGLKCLQGKALVYVGGLHEGDEEFLRRADLAHRYGAVLKAH
ncbi:MAG: homocysteine S-methyltransferase family protein [Treponema sp.]|nr:homocysteine S-methyltransferase family protein [Treponema sp.]